MINVHILPLKLKLIYCTYTTWRQQAQNISIKLEKKKEGKLGSCTLQEKAHKDVQKRYIHN